MDSSKRQISIELLRIIAMLMIVVGHIIGHGGLETLAENGEWGGITEFVY